MESLLLGFVAVAAAYVVAVAVYRHKSDVLRRL
jgi:hypothetical protein